MRTLQRVTVASGEVSGGRCAQPGDIRAHRSAGGFGRDGDVESDDADETHAATRAEEIDEICVERKAIHGDDGRKIREIVGADGEPGACDLKAVHDGDVKILELNVGLEAVFERGDDAGAKDWLRAVEEDGSGDEEGDEDEERGDAEPEGEAPVAMKRPMSGGA
jgi:hypothetical protein